MRSVLVEHFVAEDGTAFSDKAACEKHEHELRLVSGIMSRLPRVDGISSGEYAQHDREKLLAVKRDLFGVVLSVYGDSFQNWREVDPDTVHPMSGVRRVLSDYGGPISDAWHKLAFYNFDLGRQYQQPYFALHPEGATKRVN